MILFRLIAVRVLIGTLCFNFKDYLFPLKLDNTIRLKENLKLIIFTPCLCMILIPAYKLSLNTLLLSLFYYLLKIKALYPLHILY